MNWLIEPLRYSFMQHGFEAVLLVGVTCAVLGCFVVLRRMAFIGDAIAHTTLPGIVIAYLKGYNLFFGALGAGLLTALGIGWLSRRDEIREDTAIGVLFTGMFALGILIISTTRSFRDFSTMLFGDVIAITPSALALIAVITAIVLIVLALFYKELELTSVDPSYAAVVGLRADWMRHVLLVLLALAVVSGIQAVGVILTSALLVTPAAAASLLTGNLSRMMSLAAFFAVSAGFIGLYASYYHDVSSGAAIVLAGVGWFTLALIVSYVLGINRRREA